MTLRALIFDVDGTLADTEETHRQSFNDAFLRLGLPWDWDKARYRDLLRVSGGKERIAHFVDALRVPEAEKARLRALVPQIHHEKTRLYTELIADGRCQLRPGVARLLEEAARADLKLAIASTTSPANVDALLGAQLRGRVRFDAIACGDHVPAKKPAPDIYRLALSMLGRSANECVAFEDSVNGVRAAKAAGLCTVATPSQWTAGDAFEGADLVLPHLGEPALPLAPADAAALGGTCVDVASLRALLDRAGRQPAGSGAAAPAL
jgi:HAD superfamily hydrolase (TIGR01509 family)